MSTETDALVLVRDILPEYLDVKPADIALDTELAAIGADSLTLAELLFALEDRISVDLGEQPVLPRTVRELVALIEPHLPRLAQPLRA
ncbi:acyl carrier protein [Rubrivivax gelatinosus]|uniref:Acyl carrier protein n=1 Tax=Rubrivivax gelatinosus (strain NBRC 100245 / IL144) TaxID=983917 RepID=I0HPY1_RUBGI|nr:phosphopantetheine-binding protein [Rubrivivax gelatinosus]MBG6081660.1 acyl carrier protein [Rubrivivax gelatinosus]BAL95068.1 acyl carrier protein [Rubrivivax gelatinosus IL144]